MLACLHAALSACGRICLSPSDPFCVRGLFGRQACVRACLHAASERASQTEGLQQAFVRFGPFTHGGGLGGGGGFLCHVGGTWDE